MASSDHRVAIAISVRARSFRTARVHAQVATHAQAMDAATAIARATAAVAAQRKATDAAKKKRQEKQAEPPLPSAGQAKKKRTHDNDEALPPPAGQAKKKHGWAPRTTAGASMNVYAWTSRLPWKDCRRLCGTLLLSVVL